MTGAPGDGAPAATQADGPGLGTVARGAWPLLLSILLLMVGGGLSGGLLGVRAEAAAFDASATGAILGLYYLGYVAGSATVPALIRSVGHIRVFASLASVASATVVVHGVWVVPLPWMVLRFTTGLCIAGLFIVSESWLNDVATAGTRGSLLGLYNSVVTAGLAAGSLLLNVADTNGFVLFVVGSVVLSLAAVPVALAPVEAPPPRDPAPISTGEVMAAAPLGVVGATFSGFATGAALGFGAVYATRAGFGVSGASQLLAAILVGAVVGQVPLGRWSDRTDRRLVMGAAAILVGAGSALAAAATGMGSFPLVVVAGVAVGAGSFSLYGLSFAHVADYVEPEALTGVGARLILVNGLGAACGPLLASVAVRVLGPEGLFQLLGATSVAFVGLVVLRLFRRAAVDDDRRASYTPVATSATVALVEDVAAESVHDDSLAEHPARPRRRRPRRRPTATG